MGAEGGPMQVPGALEAPGMVHTKIMYVSDNECKAVTAVPRIAVLWGLGLLIWETTVKFEKPQDYLLHNRVLQRVTMPMASICLAFVLAIAAKLAARLWWARGMVWDQRTRLAVVVTTLALALQGCNLAMWVASLAYTWANPCSQTAVTVDVLGGLQWACWNTLFLINMEQAGRLLPTGAWQALWETGTRNLARLGCSCCVAGTAADEQEPGGRAGEQQKGERVDDDTAGGGNVDDLVQGDVPAAAPPPRLAALHRALSLGMRGPAAVKAALPEAAVAAPAAVVRGAVAVPTSAVRGAVDLERRVGLSVLGAAFLVLWAPTQALIIYLVVRTSMGDAAAVWQGRPPGCGTSVEGACAPPTTPCTEWDWVCSPGDLMGVTVALGWFMIASVAAFLLLTYLAFDQLAARPYNDFRVENLALRLGLRVRLPANLLFVLSFILLWFVEIDSCNNVMLIWVGLGPMHIAMTGVVVVESYLSCPSIPDQKTHKLHDALQAFAWTEAQQAPAVEARGHPEEPLFCLEAALKAVYASLHVYGHFDDTDVTNICTLKQLFGLQHHEWLREPVHDSNCLIAWGPDTLLVAFRGTASVKNIKADLKAWRSVHPPARGALLLGQRPLVHTGFLDSWRRGGYNEKVLQRIREVLEGRQHPQMDPLDCTADRCCAGGQQLWQPPPAGTGPPANEAESGSSSSSVAQTQSCTAGATVPFRIQITGHSLGGAMSTLCAIDLAKALPTWGFEVAPAALPVPASSGAPEAARRPVSLAVHTFGAPRTGNYAFARDYNQHVPDSWSVINRQDAVACQAKFIFLFKRPGKVVLLSRRGDLIVRPAAIEFSAHQTSGTAVKHHFLAGAYCPSFAAVLEGQLGAKPLPGGREALEEMWLDSGMAQALDGLFGLRQGGEGIDEELGVESISSKSRHGRR